MKKIILLFTTALAFLFHIQAQEVYVVDFESNELLFENVLAADNNIYTKVMLDGIDEFTTESGKPMLPVKTIRLMIPFGKAVGGVSFVNYKSQDYLLTHDVYPSDSTISMSSVFSDPDPAVYNSNTAFPTTQLVECDQSYFDGNNNIVTLRICPFEYHPVSGLLRQNLSIQVTVSYTNGLQGGVPNICRLQKTQDLYDKLLYHLVDNPEKIEDYRITPTIVSRLDSTLTGFPVYEHVTIAPQSYLDSLQGFVDWKRQKGYHAGVVTLEQILAKYPCGDTIGTYPIIDTPGKIRQFLHDSYSKGTCFAFIVGVNDSVEQIRFGYLTDNATPESYWLTRPTTDWYFCDLTGDWNHDQDSLYGEPTDDNAHSVADIFAGRLICSSSADFGNWFRKLAVYEKNPGLGNPSYLMNTVMTTTGKISPDSSYVSLINNILFTNRYLPSEFNNTMILDTLINNQVHPTGADIIDSLNVNDYGIMFWHNHGGTNNLHSGITVSRKVTNFVETRYKLVAEDNYDGIDVVPESGNGLDNLIYKGKPFVICAESCNVIPFEKNKLINGPRRNLGESFTVGGNYGGVAFLGFSVDNGAGNNCVQFARQLETYNYINTEAHLGIINDLVRTYNRSWRYNLNLIGDPECQIWTKVPTAMQVSVQASTMKTYVRGSVRVDVSGLQQGEKTTVTLYSRDDVFQIKELNYGHDTYVEFDSVFPVTTTPITVTVTSLNYLPYEAWLPVTSLCETHITSDTTWLTNFSTSCNVVVENDATLTIKGNIGFNTDCKLDVLPGGCLVIDGGTLYCTIPGQQWQGVRVHGTGGVGNQLVFQGHYTQGHVELRNNAQINNARVALDMWDGVHLNTTGGSVNAQDASFINNGLAFRALRFQNTNPMVEGSVLSYAADFKNCYFGVNSSYPANGELFRHHVELVEVRGIGFRGCEFELLNCPQGLKSADNTAIYAYNAGCIITDHCTAPSLPCPGNSLVRSTFHGFNMGINSIRNNHSNPLTVRNAVFHDNDVGVRTMGDAHPTILFSDFTVGGSGDCSIGVLLDGTTVFCVEENTFTKAANAPACMECFGVVVRNTKNCNIIYRNTFDGLDCANNAIGENWAGDIFDNGLEYCCNENNDNRIDFFVSHGDLQVKMSGIQYYQGSRAVAVGNTLSQSGTDYQFYNGSSSQIVYYYNANNSDEVPQTGLFFQTNYLPANSPNSCLAHYSLEGPTRMSSSERAQREADYQAAHSNYLLTKSLYDSHIDGGNTQGMVSDIASATQADAMALRAELLGSSPYLSQRTLRAVADRDDILTHSVLFEILASNPEELGRDTLIEYLENKENPLPAYMTELLRQVANGSTYRSAIESQLAAYRHAYRGAASDIARSIMNDTVLNVDDLAYWLGNLDEIDADRQIVSLFLDAGRDSAAFTLADMLPDVYGLNGDALAEHEGFILMTHLFHTLNHEGRFELELTKEETNMVDSLYLSGIGTAKNMAKGVLEYVNRFSSTECPDISTNDRGASGMPNQSLFNLLSNGESKTMFITTSPNPATNWVSVDYNIPFSGTTTVMTLTNSLGVTMKTIELPEGKGSKVLDLRDFKNGVYYYTVTQGQSRVSGKLVITK